MHVPEFFFQLDVPLTLSYDVEALYISENHESIQLKIRNGTIKNKSKRRVRSVSFVLFQRDAGGSLVEIKKISLPYQDSKRGDLIDHTEVLQVHYREQSEVEIVVAVAVTDNQDHEWQIGLHQSIFLSSPLVVGS